MLMMKHLLPPKPKQGRGVTASISVKAGGFGDSALGGS
jgi:hypothetical protein